MDQSLLAQNYPFSFQPKSDFRFRVQSFLCPKIMLLELRAHFLYIFDSGMGILFQLLSMTSLRIGAVVSLHRRPKLADPIEVFERPLLMFSIGRIDSNSLYRFSKNLKCISHMCLHHASI